MYEISYTITSQVDGATTTSSVTVRVISDVCEPNTSSSGSYQSLYEYQIGASRATLTLHSYSSNDCESAVEFYIDEVPVGDSAFSHFGWSTSGRSFVPSVPYTRRGTTVNGLTEMWWETSDYTLGSP